MPCIRPCFFDFESRVSVWSTHRLLAAYMDSVVGLSVEHQIPCNPAEEIFYLLKIPNSVTQARQPLLIVLWYVSDQSDHWSVL